MCWSGSVGFRRLLVREVFVEMSSVVFGPGRGFCCLCQAADGKERSRR
jgi:hypothetical protein